MTPALVANWRNGINSTLSYSHDSRVNATHGSKTELTSMNVSIDLKYTFAPGKGLRIPLPFMSKQWKFKSTLDTAVDMSYARNSGLRYSSLYPMPEKLPGTNTLRVSPRMTYNFSRTLNGSLFVDYSRMYSEATNQTTTTVRVGVTAIFTF
jgi:hypothetical protein